MNDDTTEADRARVQGLMVFLGSLANGLELMLGRGSDSVASRAGKRQGLNHTVSKTAKGDLQRALPIVQEEMRTLGINWPFEASKRASEPSLVTEEAGIQHVSLAIKNCVVRCSLARYGFPQKGSLCHTKHALFCGLFDQVYGGRSNLTITHAGENGCLLKLHIHK